LGSTFQQPPQQEELNVNGAEIQHLIDIDLRRAVAWNGRLHDVEPLRSTPWVAMSLLQKAIRRGQLDFALRAAASLLRDAPDRLWRRLGCIASEDIGLGDLKAVGMTTAALAGNRLRMELGATGWLPTASSVNCAAPQNAEQPTIS
jgi:replication-associated recombination protein RarA